MKSHALQSTISFLAKLLLGFVAGGAAVSLIGLDLSAFRQPAPVQRDVEAATKPVPLKLGPPLAGLGRLRPGALEGQNMIASRDFEKDLFVEDHVLAGRIDGPVASLETRRSYVCRRRRGRVGHEVVEDILTPPTAALHDFWITEQGHRVPGLVRALSVATREYRDIVSRYQDPGLLVYRDEGRYRFHLFPVLLDGTPKRAGWKLDLLLEPDADGWVTLPIPLGELSLKRFELDLELHEPRGVVGWSLPSWVRLVEEGNHRFRLQGIRERFRPGSEPFRISWRLSSRPPRLEGTDPMPIPCFPLEGGSRIAQVVGKLAGDHDVSLTLLLPPGDRGEDPIRIRSRTDAGEPGDGFLVRLQATHGEQLQVPEAVLARLRAAARIGFLHHDEATERSRAWEEMARLSLEHRIVSPMAALFADPGQEQGDPPEALGREMPRVPFSDSRILAMGERRTARPEAESRSWLKRGPAPSLSSGSGLGPLAPNYRRSGRIHFRACFANQKVMAGALEMYNREFSTDLVAEGAAAGLATTGRQLVASFLDPRDSDRALASHWRTFRTNLPAGRRWVMASEVLDHLIRRGHLMRAPEDPGASPSSGGSYVLFTDLERFSEAGPWKGIFCLRHGRSWNGQSPREQLQDLGVEDPRLLEAAFDTIARSRRTPLLRSPLELPLALLLACFLLQWRRRFPVLGTVVALATGFLAGSLWTTLWLRIPGAAGLVSTSFALFQVLAMCVAFWVGHEFPLQPESPQAPAPGEAPPQAEAPRE